MTTLPPGSVGGDGRFRTVWPVCLPARPDCRREKCRSEGRGEEGTKDQRDRRPTVATSRREVARGRTAVFNVARLSVAK